MFISNLLYFIIGVIVKIPSCYMKNWARPGCFRSQDHEEIGIIVALEIGVQLSIRGKSETFVVFTKINLFLEV